MIDLHEASFIVNNEELFEASAVVEIDDYNTLFQAITAYQLHDIRIVEFYAYTINLDENQRQRVDFYVDKHADAGKAFVVSETRLTIPEWDELAHSASSDSIAELAGTCFELSADDDEEILFANALDFICEPAGLVVHRHTAPAGVPDMWLVVGNTEPEAKDTLDAYFASNELCE